MDTTTGRSIFKDSLTIRGRDLKKKLLEVPISPKKTGRPTSPHRKRSYINRFMPITGTS